jgi:hypothetical protein
MSGSDVISIIDLEICPRCKAKLPCCIEFNPAAGHYEFWLECPGCRFRTDRVFIGKSNLTIAYPGDRQDEKAESTIAPSQSIIMIFGDWICDGCGQVNPGFTVNSQLGGRVIVDRNCLKCKKEKTLESAEKKENENA